MDQTRINLLHLVVPSCAAREVEKWKICLTIWADGLQEAIKESFLSWDHLPHYATRGHLN